MFILGIETSCDETSAAVVEAKRNKLKILSNIVSSQENLHSKYGGVVPEVAARAHIENIIPAIKRALSDAKVELEDIDLISVVTGPGLISSLMIGVDTAKSLAFALKKPIVAVNHVEAHIYANWLSGSRILNESKTNYKRKAFPMLCLVVSGGHTMLVLMRDFGKYKVVGETLDDAAGEAFDKVANILKIGYPGGPIIEKLAKKGNASVFDFPRPLLNKDNLDFSFSGLKTSVLYQVKSSKSKVKSDKKIKNEKFVSDVCASFQEAVIDVLVGKTVKAAEKFKVKTVMLAGGVAANKSLRSKLKRKFKKESHISHISYPISKLCTDNAAMVAAAGYFKSSKFKAQSSKLKSKIQNSEWKNIIADADEKLV